MKLSIVIICWNDLKVISECLRSIHVNTHKVEFEVIVSDNGSDDGSVAFIHEQFPQVRVVENGINLGFAKGNNAGIRHARGQYVLILNPDTVVHDGALDRLVSFADRHPEAGAFGCLVLNPNGTRQHSARPFPTVRRLWMAALYAWPLASFSNVFTGGEYVGWDGTTEKVVDWQSGCCVMFRGTLLNNLKGFDPQFFYHYEEVDLCRRVWNAGYPIIFTSEATITHLGGQSVRRAPIRFVLESYRSRYRYFYKHFGIAGARQSRLATIAWIRVRQAGYGMRYLLKRNDILKQRLETYRVAARWNMRLDTARFVTSGDEPKLESNFLK